MFHVKHGELSPAPESAALCFGERIDVAHRYGEILAGAGTEWGLIGPAELDRLWERHLLNSGAIAELMRPGERVGDIGSGAGLPGIPLAIARPDVRVVLVEPLLRRSEFLREVVAELGLDVTVVRGRAEDPAVRHEVGELDTVTSRAVASLDKLTRWSMPLLRVGGRMLALKGERAESEISEHERTLRSLGATDVRVVRCGVEYLNPPVTVVAATRGQRADRPARSGRRKR
ncbi:16S rRNA methyltransferase GidB [Mycolicibacterium canariasense]|uniref:Ribosomal RNA small subunit methyltransferase G n=1 Tax=Mycolicibacterium canariasense TaxID=228230 RepID=A0A117IAM0_MYCCR|nr:16S rRNA (guanine(527)-N(7))-methyltransferase RsmG [Mycolicibacterium canariasense]MCV7211120.1 16S rRNA (guanine(527)-N(7))-methyltransferase RsmG [Mycolicibacterium canariasense]ORV07976.1 16S rRNA (guanine(527)-N(7))-methyltransferase RsmG [Mycolicibacterium canariasense]GAS96588.1 16S rRNA methyltransferase GidB [Mycolicibacterium canariasense]